MRRKVTVMMLMNRARRLFVRCVYRTRVANTAKECRMKTPHNTSMECVEFKKKKYTGPTAEIHLCMSFHTTTIVLCVRVFLFLPALTLQLKL